MHIAVVGKQSVGQYRVPVGTPGLTPVPVHVRRMNEFRNKGTD